MTGVLVDEHSFPFDTSVFNFVAASSPLSCADHHLQGVLSTHFSQEDTALNGIKSGNHGSISISPPQGMACVGNLASVAAENDNGGMGYLGRLSLVTAEKGNGGMESVGKLPSLAVEKGNGGMMDYVGKLVYNTGDKKGSNDEESACRSMSGTWMMDGDGQGHVGGLKGCMGNAVDYVGDVQQSHVGDMQAAMATMNCSLPVVDDSLRRFLPSNNEEYAMDFFSSDEFRMYEFKVRRCMRGRSHDWTECPFAHPGEKARRRDPRRFHYSGTACPDFRKGNCRRGDSCELSHGVFECWLHPARYRTQICKDGKACKRRVCFFAHSPFQLRLVSPDAVSPSSNNGFSLKSAMASSIDDGFPSYPDVTLNRPPSIAHNSSPFRSASTDGYHADGFFDGFSPKNSHGFPTDGFFDGFSPNTSHGHSHGHGLPIDGFFYGFSPNNSHGLPTDDLVDGFSPKNTHGHSHSHSRGLPIDRLLVDEYGSQNSHGHGHSYTHTHSLPPDGFASDGFYDGFSSKNSYARVNLMNKLAHAGLTNNIDQILSPTSTLMGHSLSPPPLSPSLSPPESPPMSPSTVSSSWSNALARKIASLSGQPASFDVVSQIQASVAANAAESNGTPASISQFQASLLANWVHSNGAAMFARTHGPSPLSSNNLGNQRHHLDRLNSMPAATPSHNSTEFIKDQSVQATFKEAHSAQAMARVISSIQQMELRGAGVDMKNKMRSAHLFHSVPNSPNSRWAGQAESWAVNGTAEEPPVQRVESGRGLRAKIYGKLGKEAGFENENPDLGWVNELVK